MFDPSTVERYENSVYVTDSHPAGRGYIDTVDAADYDKLLDLYNRQTNLLHEVDDRSEWMHRRLALSELQRYFLWFALGLAGTWIGYLL